MAANSELLLKDLATDTGKFDRDFQLISEISAGKSTSLFAAKHKVDQQVYAIKKVMLSPLSHQRLKSGLERLLREVRLLAAIQDVNVLRYYHSWIEFEYYQAKLQEEQKTEEREVAFLSPHIGFEAAPGEGSPGSSSPESRKELLGCQTPITEGTERQVKQIVFYIQMEHCSKTLETFLDDNYKQYTDLRDKVGFARRLDIAFQIVKGLRVLHETHKLIHRDLSLTNIYVANDGTVKIGDLGFAAECKELVRECSLLLDRVELRRPVSLNDFNKFEEPEHMHDEKEVEIRGSAKVFLAPEQVLQNVSSQKADIYSLGLILLSLLYPTRTAAERAEMIGKAKVDGPPKKLFESNKDLARLIQKMLSIEPRIRPSIGQVFSQSVFKSFQKERSASLPKMEEHCQKLCGEFRIRLGPAVEWKTRYLNLNSSNLLIYKKKGDAKARISYPLKECVITPQKGPHFAGGKEKGGSQQLIFRKVSRRTASLFGRGDRNTSEKKGPARTEEGESVILIEHPDIETLRLKFFGADDQRASWLSCLLNAANKGSKKKEQA